VLGTSIDAISTDDATVVIELDGGMCLPGSIDAHDHLANLALTKLGVDASGITVPDAKRIISTWRADPATRSSAASGGPRPGRERVPRPERSWSTACWRYRARNGVRCHGNPGGVWSHHDPTFPSRSLDVTTRQAADRGRPSRPAYATDFVGLAAPTNCARSPRP
jgi:hypothetical protein